MRFFQRLLARLKAWRAVRSSFPVIPPAGFNFSSHVPSIHREVTPNGVRVFSLCGACGTTLQASATLCDECAQRRSKPARPY
jgi:hypothetical protein